MAERGPFGETEILLHSWNDTEWTGPVLRADACPTEGNTNGIYARPQQWTPNAYFLPGIDTRQKVYGLVALSGRVLVGTSGYRAEQGVVRELWVPAYPGEAVPIDVQTKLEARYMCPVHVGELPKHYEHWIWL